MAFKSKKKFEYKARDTDAVRARATAGGNREGFLAEGVKTFTPKSGTSTIRILPPTWEDADHYGYDVFAHYNVGLDGGAYLCLSKMGKKDCAICNERQRAIKEDDDVLADALKPRQRVAAWIIDRDNERDGPLMWMMPWTLDREIVQQSIDKKTQEVYNLDAPEDGYDVSFERQGEKQMTKYVGVQLARKSSPLSDDDEQMDDWLNFIAENPIPEQLVFQEEEYLDKIVGDGLVAPKDARDKAKKDKEEKPTRGKARDEKPARKARDEDERPTRSKKGKEPEPIDVDALDWEAVHEMSEDELGALAEQEQIEIDEDAVDSLEEAADFVCGELKIKKPKAAPEKEEKARPSMGARLNALRNRDKK